MNVVLGAVMFALFAAVPSLMLSATILMTQSPRRPEAFDDFLMVAWVAATSSGISTIGFLIPTLLSAPWRQLTRVRAIVIAAGLGFVSPALYFAVIGVFAVGFNTLFRSNWVWLPLAIALGVPGAALGVIAHAIAALTRRGVAEPVNL